MMGISAMAWRSLRAQVATFGDHAAALLWLAHAALPSGGLKTSFARQGGIMSNASQA